MNRRKSYEDSCRFLQEDGLVEAGNIPPLPSRTPRFDDPEPLGVSFFKSGLDGGELDDLTLPRTYFGRSEINETSFRNTDLSESSLCWNDFVEVDFTDADLSHSDMRASLYQNVLFVGTTLRQVDLRHAEFIECDFSNADMYGAKLVRSQAEAMHLSLRQEEEIDWQTDAGPEPEGG